MGDAAEIAVLGASGAIGQLAARAAVERGRPVRACARHPWDAPGVPHPLTGYSRREVRTAVRGCSAVIATVGLPYRSRLWLADWAPMVREILAACADEGIPLTLLDNLYVYGDAGNPLREDSPLTPCSAKGRARLAGWEAVREALDRGQDVLVARASDFLGPRAEVCLLPWSTLAAAAEHGGRALTWIGDPEARHSFSFTEEVAAALVELAGGEAVRREPGVVHLPTLHAFSARELARRLGERRGRPLPLRVLRRPAVAAAALLSRRAAEQREMMYQVERDFIVDDERIRSQGWSGPKMVLEDLARRLEHRPGLP